MDVPYLPGSLFSKRFVLEAAAGQGGMGRVFRARDRYSGAVVALKVMGSRVPSEEAEARFVSEAELLCELRHPAIVEYVTHGRTPSGECFLAMEWLDGEDLGKRLARGPLSLRDTLILIDRVAEALAFIHNKDILHRDIKPSNLFLVDGDVHKVKVLDLGIARHVGSSTPRTRTGTVVGTPEYLSPEHARGERALTPGSDLFSLGCVFYECLAGLPPFVAEHAAAVLAQILLEEPPPIESRRPGLGGGVISLLQKLLDKQPARRPKSAQALRDELAALGEILEPGQTEPLDVSVPSRDMLGQAELSLLSIVLAAPATPRSEPDSGVTAEVVQRPGSAQMQLLAALREQGIAAELLAGEFLLATVSSLGSATDLAKQAARVALLVKSRWPEAKVVMTTGRGRLHGQTMIGDVVAQAGRILDVESHPAAGESLSGVWIDSLSARLLDGRFILSTPAGGMALLHEELAVDASRLLLGKPTPYVGRDSELALLQSEIMACVDESEARAIVVTAAPGMGKSRLLAELLRRIERQQIRHTLLLGRGDLMSAGSPFEILRSAILRLCGLSGSEPVAEQESRLRSRLAQHLAAAEQERIVAFMATLCNIPIPDAGRPMLQAARQEPKIMHAELRQAVLDWVAAECAAAPVLLVLDDLQWGDELTVGVIAELLHTHAQAPLFVLAFARPELRELFPRLWVGHKVREIVLRELSKKACERLIKQVLETAADADTVKQAIEQSAGNALFLEEFIRAMATGKTTERPETILAMMQARIGWLDAGLRRIVRAAAIFGSTFWTGGLAALLGASHDLPTLERRLIELAQKEFFVPRVSSRLLGETEYSFRHALVREAAYSLLTDGDLRIGHLLAGRYLEQAGEQDPMILAEHARRGGDQERATHHYVLAAIQAYEQQDPPGTLRRADLGLASGAAHEQRGILLALRCSATLSSNTMLDAIPVGLAALDLLPAGSRWWCVTMGTLFIAAAQERAPERLLSLVQRFVSAEPAAEARVAYVDAAAWVVTMFSLVGVYDVAQRSHERMERVIKLHGEGDIYVQGLAKSAQTWYLRSFASDPYRAMTVAMDATRLLAESKNRALFVRTQAGLGAMLAELGDWEAGERAMRFALSGSPTNSEEDLYHITARTYLALLLVRQEDAAALDEVCALAGQVLSSDVSPAFSGMARTALAHAALLRGDYAHAAEEARHAAELCRGMPPYALDARTLQVRALLGLGRSSEARALAEESLAVLAGLSGLTYGEVALRLEVAEARQACGDRTGAKEMFAAAEQALAVRAERIPDEALRHLFLTRIPAHARLRARTS